MGVPGVEGNVRGDQGGSGGCPGVPGGQEGCPRVQGKCRGSKGVPKLPLFSLKYVCTNSQKTNHLIILKTVPKSGL